jgi:peptide/nickel transport system ATP-binding protein
MAGSVPTMGTPTVPGPRSRPATSLELRDVTVTYSTPAGPVTALRSVNIHLASGQTVGVAGGPGSGKSTLVAAATRSLPRGARLDGQVLLDGVDTAGVARTGLRVLRWAGPSIEFHNAVYGLNPVHRINDQIAEAMLRHGLARPGSVDTRVRRLLARVGMTTRRARAFPQELTASQRQRVMIAIALASDPRVVVADEPTTALDVLARLDVLELFAEAVTERGGALLVACADEAALARACQRVVVLPAAQISCHAMDS